MKIRARRNLRRLRKESDGLLKAKYIKGNKEHGGTLLNMGLNELVKEALDENTDQRVYLLEIRRKLKITGK